MPTPLRGGSPRRIGALFASLPLLVFATSLGVVPVAAQPAPAPQPEAPTTQAAALPPTFTLDDSRVNLLASFVSSVGWVQPADPYDFRVFVANPTASAATNVKVTIDAPPATPEQTATFTGAEAVQGGGTVTVTDTQVTWEIASLAAGTGDVPTVALLVVSAQAASLTIDPEIVWKDLSSLATLTYDGYSGDPITSATHGPKVIPPGSEFQTARYGDKPFPIVTAEYQDIKHQGFNPLDSYDNDPAQLETVVNDPAFPGSTFNLYQEMSYGQLYPQGDVPSAGIAAAGFPKCADDTYDCWEFTSRELESDCLGVTFGDSPVNPVPAPYSERIVDGWYQLPGNHLYYGQDFPTFTLGLAGQIDSACGPLGKAVYDAALLADPEVDYNQFDSDKDGVADFFMLVFAGCGGNGASQVGPAFCPYPDQPPSYDNIWPHSSDLQQQFQDAETGLRGFISGDQLRSIHEVPQCWLDDTYGEFADCQADGGPGLDSLPVYVRVGPYNVNPETAFQSASVISHEYGHHLGLPDFYNSCCEYYGDLNLRAADYSQHMTIFSKQDLGWVVPDFLQPGQTIPLSGGDWGEIKNNIGEIHWQRQDGTPYTLSATNGDQNIRNGQAYGAKLPHFLILDASTIPVSPPHVWWSGRGNDFGCSPTDGHNLDIWLPELTDMPEGTDVTLQFNSSWDIEWDWDFGFVLTTTDGEDYVSHPSDMGYTTDNTWNPNNIQCQEQLNNGLTGTSGAYEDSPSTTPPFPLERNPADNDYSDGAPFLPDQYDISDLVGGQNPVLRFSYFTDGAFDRPGWFIDDIKITAGDQVIYESNFETDREPDRLIPGGCSSTDNFRVAAICTAGWNWINAELPSEQDHAYYLELRDQTGFDFNGWEQSERGDTSWQPGVYIEYTNESHGYGNNGVPGAPAQMYLDATPQPGSDCVVENGDPSDNDDPDANCDDMSFLGTNVNPDRDHFDDFVDADQPEGYISSFEDPDSKYGDDFWHFDYSCLSVDVIGMAGQEGGPAPTEENRLIEDLTTGAVLSAGDGCLEFAYGQLPPNLPPVAVAQAKPPTALVGAPITFDGSGSSDDRQAPSELLYAWDFGDNETGSGQTVQHAYDAPGVYTAELTVTDLDAASDVATVDVTITAAASSSPSPSASVVPSTSASVGAGASASASGGAGAAASPQQSGRLIPNTAGDGEGAAAGTVGALLIVVASVGGLAVGRYRTARRTRI